MDRNFGSTIALLSPAPLVYEDCPHCEVRTLCEVSVLHRHARCLECGRPTRRPDEQDPAVERRQKSDRPLVAA